MVSASFIVFSFACAFDEALKKKVRPTAITPPRMHFVICWVFTVLLLVKRNFLSLCGLFASIPNHFFEGGFERGLPLDGAFEPTFEFDPALIEALDHLNSRRGILHTLSAKDLFPSSSWNRLRLYRLAENVSQHRRDVCRRDTCLRLKLDDPLARPRFKQEGTGECADIFRRDHGNSVFDRLKIAVDDPFAHGRADISSMVLHEPSRSKKCDRHRELPERLLHHVKAIEQIRPGDVGTNRRKSNDSLCLRLPECCGKTVDQAFGFRKSRRGIEQGWQHHEDCFGARYSASQAVAVGHIGDGDRRALRCPGLALSLVANNSAYLLTHFEQPASSSSANSTSNSDN